jgi:hypothetical protein
MCPGMVQCVGLHSQLCLAWQLRAERQQSDMNRPRPTRAVSYEHPMTPSLLVRCRLPDWPPSELQDLVGRHQKARSLVTDSVVDAFMQQRVMLDLWGR